MNSLLIVLTAMTMTKKQIKPNPEFMYTKGDVVRVGNCQGVVVKPFENHYQLMDYTCINRPGSKIVWVDVNDIDGLVE